MKQMTNLQDVFLSKAKKDNVGITIFLVNGYQIKGTVMGYDNYTILLEGEGRQQLIYKHAISTIIPSQKIRV